MNTKQTFDSKRAAPDIAAEPDGLTAMEPASMPGWIGDSAAADGATAEVPAEPSHKGAPARRAGKPRKAKSGRAGKSAALSGPKQRQAGSLLDESASGNTRAARSNRPNPPVAKTDARQASANARSGRDGSKADAVLKKLRLAKGVSIAQLAEVTGWQAHSVRGFLSAVVRKKLGLKLVSDVGKDGVRRYRISDGPAG